MQTEAQWLEVISGNCGDEDPAEWAVKLADVSANIRGSKCMRMIVADTAPELKPFLQDFDWVTFAPLVDFDVVWVNQKEVPMIAIERKTPESLHKSVTEGTYTAKQKRIAEARVLVKIVVRQGMDNTGDNPPLTFATLHLVETVAFLLLHSLALADNGTRARLKSQSVLWFQVGQLCAVISVFVLLYTLL